ncbi:flagellar motor protein MotS [Virgibacillus sp. SK37]|uniref:flagellar motor protein MotS n=1 Tax=Virgibacillus sp. SK37 TaxID=403957 RepID=UPI0004D19AF7|nr:flagellar motor protein MotS [Virgibacillus sp. SK37]AIF43177.1 flagellar motor protein MotS [Virgibacillus sp. SK37]
MKRRVIKKKQNSGAPKWMVTYSDMVTLILVFFILLFSMSQIDLVKFDAISESFRNRMIFDFNPSPVPMENPTQSSSVKETGKESNEFEVPVELEEEQEEISETQSLNGLMDEIEKYLDKNELNNVISANRTERGVVLVLQEKILFDSGEAKIIDGGKPFLNKIGSLLNKMPNQVKVEGHTDSRPISNYRYPSNWELSGARASSVIRYLIDKNKFDESRFSSVGYADTRPLVPNTSSDNWKKNRRVEIVVLDEGATIKEGDNP